MRDQQACDIVVEVVRGARDGLLADVCAAGVESVREALITECLKTKAQLEAEAEEAAAEGSGDDGENAQPASSSGAVEPLLTHYFGSRALRRLVLMSAEEGPSGGAARDFTSALWQRVLSKRCKALAGSHADKVLAALLHCGCEAVVKAASKELAPLVKQPLDAWSAPLVAGHTHTAGAPPAASKAGAPAASTAAAAAGRRGGASAARANGKAAAAAADAAEPKRKATSAVAGKDKKAAAAIASEGPAASNNPGGSSTGVRRSARNLKR